MVNDTILFLVHIDVHGIVVIVYITYPICVLLFKYLFYDIAFYLVVIY